MPSPTVQAPETVLEDAGTLDDAINNAGGLTLPSVPDLLDIGFGDAFSGPIADVLGVWEFDGNLEDRIANNDFGLNDEDVYLAGAAISGRYKIIEQYNLIRNEIERRESLLTVAGREYEASTAYSGGAFTVGFWYYSPGLIGYTRHAIDRSLAAKTAPIIGLGHTVERDEIETFSDVSFIIVETAASNSTNRIRLILSDDGTSASYFIDSDAYTPGWVHVLCTYSPSDRRARIDINGKFGPSYPAPSLVNTTISTMKLNVLNYSYVAHHAEQVDALMHDLVFMASYASTEDTSIRFIRYGWEYITGVTETQLSFYDFGISYSQPSTVTTNQIYVEGSDVFLARSDGEVLRGNQPIWDNQITFDRQSIINNLSISPKCAVEEGSETCLGSVSRSSEGFTIKGASVRI